jgi:REP element-mobilizing transposase RayT
MARKARGHVPAGFYHVWRRAVGPTQMFLDDIDRTIFCNRLTMMIGKFEWKLVAFVLMPTHFHLVLEVADGALSPGMHGLFGPYAQGFNRRHGRSGHLRAEPFKLRTIHDDADLAGAVRYVARNPVRAKLCAAPEDWYWSSYSGSADYASPSPFRFVDDRDVISWFDENDRRKAIEVFRAFVAAP